MQWNANRMLQHLHGLQAVLDIEKNCLIFESQIAKESNIKFKGYKVYHIQ